MSSTFFGLNIAYSGLLASNAALLTTANNVSNVQTEGYSRQEVNQTAADPIRTFQKYGCAGAGVQTLSVERVRDEFYDTKYWANNSTVGEYNMKSYYMDQIEGYFYDNGSNAGFTAVFDAMMTESLEELMKNPADNSLKSQFVGNASSLADYFNGISGNLLKVQADLNSEIKLKVDEINSIADQLATLNKQINTIELTGAHANELRDERDALIDQLSEIVDVEVVETPIYDTNTPDRLTGGNRYIVRIAGGQLLVDSSKFQKLACVARENYEKVNQTDMDGLYDVHWLNDDGSLKQKFNLYNAAMKGSLKGLVEMRDGNNGEFIHGTILDPQINGYTDADGQLHDMVSIAVGKSYQQDLNQCNLSDQGGVIKLGDQLYYYDSWEFNITTDADGNASYTYNFILSNDPLKNPTHVTTDRKDKIGSVGDNVAYMGVPYYMKQMNQWVRTFAEKINDTLKKGDNNDGTLLFTGNHKIDDDQFDFPDATRYDLLQEQIAANKKPKNQSVTVTSTDDSYYRLTAQNMNILTAIKNDASLLKNKYSPSDGVEQNDLLRDLSKIASDKSVLSFRGSSANEFLQSMLSDVALNASNASTFKECYTNIRESIDSKRLSISGVDEDEEAVNLVKFQNAYNLSAKMIQVFSEIYDRLILQTGV